MPAHLTALANPALFIAWAAGLATLSGGVFALRLRTRLNLLAGFGGGAIISIAVADLVPQAVRLGEGSYSPVFLLGLTVAGFAFYWMVDRLRHALGGLGRALGPLTLVVHSLVDGMGIGVAFSVSPTIGLAVGAAVLAHDLLDGSNTVTLSFSGSRSALRAWLWLGADALAPIVGAAASRLAEPPAAALPPLLAMLAGFFVFIGGGELLPLSLKASPILTVALSALCGAALVTVIVFVGVP